VKTLSRKEDTESPPGAGGKEKKPSRTSDAAGINNEKSERIRKEWRSSNNREPLGSDDSGRGV